MHRLLLLAALTAACSTDPTASSPSSLGGKADDGTSTNTGTGSDAVLTCDGLTLEALGDAGYRAVVTDPEAVAYFVAQSETYLQTTVEYGGFRSEVSVQKRLPWMVEAQDAALIVTDLSRQDEAGSRYLTSGPPGTELWQRSDASFVLEVRGLEMVSSHQVVYYVVGQWQFSACEGAPTHQPVVIDFDASWNEEQTGPIHAGDSVILHYDPARLAVCSGTQYGRPVWNVTANYMGRDGVIQSVLVTDNSGAELLASDPEIVIPAAPELIIWFEATNLWGCHEYDSDYGANYHFNVI